MIEKKGRNILPENDVETEYCQKQPIDLRMVTLNQKIYTLLI
jgi:hypothetical protein